MQTTHIDPPASYLGLIKSNKNFRRLWLSTVVSQLGDWFNFIALITIITDLSASPLKLGVIFIAKALPGAIFSPIAGLLVDRFNRRRLMIFCDVARAIIVLGFLLVDSDQKIYLAYVFTTLQVVVSAIFHPAQAAALPNIVSKQNLLTANTIMAASWSTMLAVGAAIGGFATLVLGPDSVFVVDSITYIVSAVFIIGTVIPQEPAEKARLSVLKTIVQDLRSGWGYLREHPFVRKITWAKAVWASGGSALVFMLALLAQEIDPGRESLAFGILFAARGLGTGLGPIIARRWVPKKTSWPRMLGLLVLTSGLFYFLVGLMPWTYVVIVFVVVAHTAGGANWVLATVILQQETEDNFRGRVFATEWVFIMLTDALSTLSASLALEFGLLSLRGAVLVFALIQIVFGAIWAASFLRPKN